MAKGKKAHLDTSMQTLAGGLVGSQHASAVASESSVVLDVNASAAASSGDSTLPGGIGAREVGPVPEMIGHYKILRLVGAGGMGAVYEAEQNQPRRTVALKIMRGALSSPQASRRFEYESQLLARLRHPGIAQVYEAGTHTEAGTGLAVPYFAMEFIPDAKELTAYADSANLDREGRIALFQRVCDAVQHGHQRGVIHRDLKPANILVDAGGNPKIIDFGVARASAEEGTARVTQQTTPGQLIGTLQYMAPEQCGGDSADIDVRADVYALGVILYELLTGRPPYELEGKSLFEAAMIVREDAPTRPGMIVRELRGDLETILYKSLEKDRARRYDSSADLAADLTRYLKCEPILARQIGMGGKLVRWVKRNRSVATVLAVSAAVLIATSVVLITQIVSESRRANAALVVAQRNLKAAQDNFRLIRDMFSKIGPQEAKSGLVDVAKLLDGATEGLAKQEPDMPATQADFRELLGVAYKGVGKYTQELEHRRRAVEIRERLAIGPDKELADSLHGYAAALYRNGRVDDAIPIYERSLAMRRALNGEEHEDIAASLTHLAACRLKKDDVEDARKLYAQALSMRQRLTKAADSQNLAASLNNMAKPYSMMGEYDRAEGYLNQSLEMIRRVLGREDLFTAIAEQNLAVLLLDQGKSEEALALLRHAYGVRRSKFRPGHPELASIQLVYARALFAVERSEEAATLADQALESAEAEMSAQSTDLAEAVGQTGLIHAGLGHTVRGIALLQRSLNLYEASEEATRRDRDEAALRLGYGLAQLGKDAEAQATLQQAFESLGDRMVLPLLRAEAAGALAAIYERQGKASEAEQARAWAILTPNAK